MLLRMSSLNPVEFSVRVKSPSEANYTAEARSIQAAAAARRTNVVKLEQIVFFSTSTGGRAPTESEMSGASRWR